MDDDITRFDLEVQLRIMAMRMALSQWESDDCDEVTLAANTIYEFLKDGSTPE